jgi:hypothetical protein
VEPLFQLEDQGRGFGVLTQFDKSFGGSELMKLRNFIFPVAEKEAFELGAVRVVQSAFDGLLDESLDFFGSGQRRGGPGIRGPALFANKENGKQSQGPEDAKNDEQDAITTQFGRWVRGRILGLGKEVAGVNGGGFKGGVKTGDWSFVFDSPEKVGNVMLSGIKSVDLEVVAKSFRGRFDFKDPDDERGLVVFAWNDFHLGAGDVEVLNGGGETQGGGTLNGETRAVRLEGKEKKKKCPDHLARRFRDCRKSLRAARKGRSVWMGKWSREDFLSRDFRSSSEVNCL